MNEIKKANRQLEAPVKNLTRAEARELAGRWADRGIPVGPVALTYDPGKGKVNKRPLCPHGFKDFTTDPHRLDELFSSPGWSGAWAVGALPGPAGYVVLDIDSREDLNRFTAYEPDPTFQVNTPSGFHFWYRKLEDVFVGTRCDIEGVDCARADQGFIMVEGNVSEWGDWHSFDDFDTDVSTMSRQMWTTLERRDRSTAMSTGGLLISGLDQVVQHLTDAGRHQDLDALAIIVEKYGGHSPYLRGDHLYVTRPGKTAGVSASIGYVAPGIVKVFTPNWHPFKGDSRYIVDDNDLVADNDLSWLRASTSLPMDSETQPEDLLELIDFRELHERGNDLVDGLISPGKWTAFVAPAKQGKTTFIMNIAVRLAAGFDPFTGQSREPVAVLYVDGEMGRLDLEERIFDLGFDPVDLENFYACDLAPFLDEPAGGRKVLRTALHYRCQLVVIDGLNGTLMGDENDNTSLRNFFDHTVRPLKSHEIAICSGDNTGKDVSKGPRGTSVKLDKPDAVYRLQRTDNGVKVVAVVSRSSAFVREVDYNIEGLEGDTPLTYRPEGTSWPDGTLKAARLLEHHNIPLDWGRRKVRQRLRELGVDGFRNHILDAGQKYRRKMFNNTEVRTLVDHAKQGS